MRIEFAFPGSLYVTYDMTAPPAKGTVIKSDLIDADSNDNGWFVTETPILVFEIDTPPKYLITLTKCN